MKIKYPICFWFGLLISLFVWLLFYPGILARDSLYPFTDAYSGIYMDWHPPILSYILTLVFKIGGGLGLITFFQCFFGIFGIRYLATSALQVNKVPGIDMISSSILLVLVSPLTPLSIYLATFWKDTWYLVALTWLLAIFLDVLVKVIESRKISFLDWLSVILSMWGVLIIRHNAYFVYFSSAFSLFLILKFYPIDFRKKIVVMISPLILFGLYNFFEYQIMNTRRMHIENVVYAIDLLSMAHIDNSIISESPYLRSNLMDKFGSDFEIGDEGTSYALSGEFLKLSYFDDSNQIRGEYYSALRNHPLEWLSVKWLMYIDFLRPAKDRYLYHDHIEYNKFGVEFNKQFTGLRNLFFTSAAYISHNPFARWFSYIHLPWLVINFGVVTVYSWIFFVKKNLVSIRMASIFLIPLVYYLSYFFAVTYSDFRFLYPSTLVVQVLALTFVFGYTFQWFAKFYEDKNQFLHP